MRNIQEWMEQSAPISPKLNEMEQAALKAKIIELNKKENKKKPVCLVFILAATLCLLAACGAAILGLFNTMTSTNNTSLLVEKYSLFLEDMPSVTVDEHTVTIQALIRSENTVRIIFDISGTKRETLNYRFFRSQDGVSVSRLQVLINNQPTGHTDTTPNITDNEYNLIKQSGRIGAVTETNAYRYFADVILQGDTSNVSFYVLEKEGGAEVIQLDLPEPIQEKNVLTTGTTVHFELSDGDMLDCTIKSVRITPFCLVLQGDYSGQMQNYPAEKMNWSSIIRLFREDGSEIYVGKEGSLYAGSNGLVLKILLFLR